MDRRHHGQDDRHQVRRGGHGRRRAARRRRRRHHHAQADGREPHHRPWRRPQHQCHAQAPGHAGQIRERPACDRRGHHGGRQDDPCRPGQPGAGECHQPARLGCRRLERRRREDHPGRAARREARPRRQGQESRHDAHRRPARRRLYPRHRHGGLFRRRRLQHQRRHRCGRDRRGHRRSEDRLHHRRRRHLHRLLRQVDARVACLAFRDGQPRGKRHDVVGHHPQDQCLRHRAFGGREQSAHHQRHDAARARARRSSPTRASERWSCAITTIPSTRASSRPRSATLQASSTSQSSPSEGDSRWAHR